MAGPRTRDDRMNALIHEIKSELEQAEAAGRVAPIERRKLRTLTEACGLKRASPQFLDRLRQQVADAGLFTDPDLGDRGLRSDDYVRFAAQPFPAERTFFPSEAALQKFVKLAIEQRVGIFRNLQLVSKRRAERSIEVILPSRKRIDILCEERTKSGVGALVAVELKREYDRGAPVQVLEYMDELKRLNPGRQVKGMIIEGSAGMADPSIVQFAASKGIRWHVYDVSFRSEPTAPGAE